MTGVSPYGRPRPKRRAAFIALVTALIVVVAAVAITRLVAHSHRPSASWGPGHPVVIRLPAKPMSYIGAYARGVPASYAPMDAFAAANGVRPNIDLYYSGWGEVFKSAFAEEAAAHHAVPLVQINPGTTSLAAIAAGAYDGYLRSFAEAVGNFGARTGQGVIIGFGHEPNGNWYPWGFGHAAPATWIAAWRHIVTVFRQQGADDVTWLWTVNVIDTSVGIVSPVRWWPGSKYVTWVGIDGYYYDSSTRFAGLFGPTIAAVRTLTRDPILVSETGVKAKAGKPAKIADVFAGVRAYGLLGLVWFDVRNWRLDTPAAAAAFAAAAAGFGKLATTPATSRIAAIGQCDFWQGSARLCAISPPD
jgi:mannan endo-1,4-beta-mannosidase